MFTTCLPFFDERQPPANHKCKWEKRPIQLTTNSPRSVRNYYTTQNYRSVKILWISKLIPITTPG